MKASLSWLRALVPALDATGEQATTRLALAGLAMEAPIEVGEALREVRVASVREVTTHPLNPSLRVVHVATGRRPAEPVVCEASMAPEAGALVCLARTGAILPGRHGPVVPHGDAAVQSAGVLCSEADLGIGDDASSPLVLASEEAHAGQALPEAVPAVRDTILTMTDTKGRCDLLGHLGLARELAALYGVPFSAPGPDAPARLARARALRVDVRVEAPHRCAHYGAIVVDDVTVAPAPLWLRCRLHALGIGAPHSVAALAALVMLEYGHPVDAFDLDAVQGGTLVVREARAGERIATLSGATLRLGEQDLVIADGEGPLSLAGIVDSKRGCVHGGTKRVVFGCGYYEPSGIEQTAARHRLRTAASERFACGVDRNDAPEVLAHAGALATRLAAASAVPGAVHVAHEAFAPRQLQLHERALVRRLGNGMALQEAGEVLTRLGFRVTPLRGVGEASVQVEVPSFRSRVATERDLVEEVARVAGRRKDSRTPGGT